MRDENGQVKDIGRIRYENKNIPVQCTKSKMCNEVLQRYHKHVNTLTKHIPQKRRQK